MTFGLHVWSVPYPHMDPKGAPAGWINPRLPVGVKVKVKRPVTSRA